MGGNDMARIYDSPGDDLLVATPTSVTLQSNAFSQTTLGYSRTNIFARDGFDSATLVGSAEVDTFAAQTTAVRSPAAVMPITRMLLIW